MQEKPQSKDGEARTTKQVHGTEQSPRGGWQACRSQVVHTGWKLSCQELAELFKQGCTAKMNFGSSDEQGERGEKHPGIAGKTLTSERG